MQQSVLVAGLPDCEGLDGHRCYDRLAMTAYYWKNLKDIPQRQLADNDEYHALIQKKIAAENALKVLISEEAWRRYLELDAISNELESVRLEAMYLAGAADHEKLSK